MVNNNTDYSPSAFIPDEYAAPQGQMFSPLSLPPSSDRREVNTYFWDFRQKFHDVPVDPSLVNPSVVTPLLPVVKTYRRIPSVRQVEPTLRSLTEITSPLQKAFIIKKLSKIKQNLEEFFSLQANSDIFIQHLEKTRCIWKDVFALLPQDMQLEIKNRVFSVLMNTTGRDERKGALKAALGISSFFHLMPEERFDLNTSILTLGDYINDGIYSPDILKFFSERNEPSLITEKTLSEDESQQVAPLFFKYNLPLFFENIHRFGIDSENQPYYVPCFLVNANSEISLFSGYYNQFDVVTGIFKDFQQKSLNIINTIRSEVDLTVEDAVINTLYIKTLRYPNECLFFRENPIQLGQKRRADQLPEIETSPKRAKIVEDIEDVEDLEDIEDFGFEIIENPPLICTLKEYWVFPVIHDSRDGLSNSDRATMMGQLLSQENSIDFTSLIESFSKKIQQAPYEALDLKDGTFEGEIGTLYSQILSQADSEAFKSQEIKMNQFEWDEDNQQFIQTDVREDTGVFIVRTMENGVEHFDCLVRKS